WANLVRGDRIAIVWFAERRSSAELTSTAEGASRLLIWTEGTGLITSRADQRQPSLGGSFWAAPQRFPRSHRPACRMCPRFRACALPPPKPASDTRGGQTCC